MTSDEFGAFKNEQPLIYDAAAGWGNVFQKPAGGGGSEDVLLAASLAATTDITCRQSRLKAAA